MPQLHELFSSAIGLLPEGGQRTARRNAWAAMSADLRRARDRREAAAVFGAPSTASQAAARGASSSGPAGMR
jgi:hypothetical protein